MHKETLSLENTDKSTSESWRDKKHPNMPFFNDPSPTLNGLPPFLSLVFPSSPFFLSDFISWPFLQLVSCFQITLLPKGRALLYHLPLFIPHSRLSSALMRTAAFPPSCHLRLPSPLLFFSLFLPPKTRPVPRPPPTLLSLRPQRRKFK